MSKRAGGDGDPCPIDPEHGRMTFLQPPSVRQYCAHQSHDGPWTKQGKLPSTPAFWPKGSRALAEAVAEYNGVTTKAAAEPSALPSLDITLEV